MYTMKTNRLIATILGISLYFVVAGFSSASVVGLIGAFILLASKRNLWFD